MDNNVPHFVLRPQVPVQHSAPLATLAVVCRHVAPTRVIGGRVHAVAPVVRAQAMRRANPAFIVRNHRVEEALSAAVERADYAPFATLLHIVLRPFDDQPAFAAFADPAPAGQGCYRTFCGT